MVALVRYGFLGYSETNVGVSLALLSAAALTVFLVNYRLFVSGYRVRD